MLARAGAALLVALALAGCTPYTGPPPRAAETVHHPVPPLDEEVP
ncbi:hypothetical protein ACL02T_32950 [Pseudonocardia sp. RS010]